MEQNGKGYYPDEGVGRGEINHKPRTTLDNIPSNNEAAYGNGIKFDGTTPHSADERSAQSLADEASDRLAKIFFAAWLAFLLLGLAWMLRLIPKTGGFPVSDLSGDDDDGER
eukprot:CAMPEP_0172584884 /NCGR_PEP_ID=MMETSP1068-20121228/4434_1 /TAXON_ID=35684 /ORGANISM="Pseudopedinella elastica, Strain CCMP716" /LENGTH=111 /DNA_ID=CAMNT_0013379195 /DNA_START=161 /DNA_END=496 /DNA_ORIENTATION=+